MIIWKYFSSLLLTRLNHYFDHLHFNLFSSQTRIKSFNFHPLQITKLALIAKSHIFVNIDLTQILSRFKCQCFTLKATKKSHYNISSIRICWKTNRMWHRNYLFGHTCCLSGGNKLHNVPKRNFEFSTPGWFSFWKNRACKNWTQTGARLRIRFFSDGHAEQKIIDH